ncbi:MAG: hypothetical protein QNJ27_02560 [Simkaniaceae bacterium]|nr:hypothetical protein [Simkaniaceae bacterium]
MALPFGNALGGVVGVDDMSKCFSPLKKFLKNAANLELANYAIPPVCAFFMLKADLLSADQMGVDGQCVLIKLAIRI